MSGFLQRLKKGGVLLADGAMGSLLMDKGLRPGECPEWMNLTHPEILEEVAELYLNAGSDIIQTNTFGGSPAKLSDYQLEDKTEEINKAAVECVRRIVKEHAFVSGSCGPTGKMLQPYGDADPDVLAAGFTRQINALINAGVDVICIETMIDLNEATLAVQAAKTISPEIPVMATMTFNETPRGFFTMMGVSVKQAAKGLEQAGADVVGSNCGNGIENMIKIAREFKSVSSLPILIQSNAGLPEMKEGKVIYPETPQWFAGKAKELVDIGVSIIGGCCGTTPDHIRAIRKIIG